MSKLPKWAVEATEKSMLDAKEKWMLGYDAETSFEKLGRELFLAGVQHVFDRVENTKQYDLGPSELRQKRVELLNGVRASLRAEIFGEDG